MKKPEKPKPVQEILRNNSENVFKLLENKEIKEFVAECNKEYVHWDKVRYKKIPGDKDPKLVWALIKIFRSNQYRTLRFGNWNFRYALPEDVLRKLHLLDKGAAGRLEASIESVNVEGKERYMISSLMEEAIASSQLEGAATTRKVAKEILRQNKKPKNYSEQMIVNGFRTMQRIVKMKEKTITPEVILELHKSITEDTLKKREDEGRFRDNNEVIIGDDIDPEIIYYTPPDYKQISALIKQFCDFANNDSEFIHPVIKGIILHFLMGYIHPFNDGNGRTARTLFYWYVLTRGYWLFEFMAISRILLHSKAKYGLAYLYTETDENDLTYFINFNLSAIEGTLHEMESYIARKQKEQQESLRLIKEIRDINLRQAEIFKEFLKQTDKAFLIKEIMNTFAVAYDTARTDLMHLAALGYIEQIKIKNKFVFRFKSRNIKHP